MAYNPVLANRIREALASQRGITEKQMFGGIAFLARGYMFVGIIGDTLMARVGPAHYAQALKRKHVRVMDFTGKPQSLSQQKTNPFGSASLAPSCSALNDSASSTYRHSKIRNRNSKIPMPSIAPISDSKSAIENPKSKFENPLPIPLRPHKQHRPDQHEPHK